MEEIQKVEEALKEENAKNNHLKQQTDVRLPPCDTPQSAVACDTTSKPEPFFISGVHRRAGEGGRLQGLDRGGSRHATI